MLVLLFCLVDLQLSEMQIHNHHQSIVSGKLGFSASKIAPSSTFDGGKGEDDDDEGQGGTSREFTRSRWWPRRNYLSFLLLWNWTSRCESLYFPPEKVISLLTFVSSSGLVAVFVGNVQRTHTE